jgi:predicted esterase
MGKFCTWLLLPSLALAAATNPPAPIKVIELTVPANNAAFYEAQRKGVPNLKSLNGVVALPQGFDPKKTWPTLVVTTSSGGSAVQAWRSFTNVALGEGWIVTAVDGPKVPVESDGYTFSRAMISALFEHLRRMWPQSKQWPLACAGFSGGGKRAAMTAADLMHNGDRVIGVFMGGSNNDRASDGFFVSRPGEAFLDVPIFLSNGRNDPIAGPGPASLVRQSMEQTGFRKVRLELYAGGHQLDSAQLRAALQWFRPPAKR